MTEQVTSETNTNLVDGLPEPSPTPEARPQHAVESFTTSRGSIYTYDVDGHTTRFKAKTGVEQPKQDITVFVDVGVGDASTIAAAYLLRGAREKSRIDIVEQQPDGSMKVVSDILDVAYPDQLQVCTFRGETVVKSRPASVFPRIGAYVFDSRRFDQDGVTRTERHLGHRVSSIRYKT